MDYGSSLSILNMQDNDHEIMQFTGLKDKNGKEIYEHDLIDFAGIVWEVRFCPMGAEFTLYSTTPRNSESYIASAGMPIRDFNWLDKGKAGYKQDIKKHFPIEVIGNIYENPELLARSDQDKSE